MFCFVLVIRMMCGYWFRMLVIILEVRGLDKNRIELSFLKSFVLDWWFSLRFGYVFLE